MARHTLRVLWLTCPALLGTGLAPAARAEAPVHVPTCALFLDFGARWVGLDEAVAAEVLGLPLYALTDADIDLVAKGLQACLAKADTPEAKAVLEEDMKHMSSLTAARNRVRRAFADFQAAKKQAQPKLEQLAARIDDLPPTPRSRGAVDDAEATVSAIFFELEQKRLRAQVKQPLADDDPAYARAVAAIARKHEAYAEQARQEVLGMAQGALDQHGAEVARLDFPPAALDATIILQNIDAGRPVRWLTLRQWAALVFGNPENTALKVARGETGAPADIKIEVVRPGYSRAEFAFRQDGHDLLLVQSGVDGRLGDIDTLDKRREANDLLLAVVQQR